MQNFLPEPLLSNLFRSCIMEDLFTQSRNLDCELCCKYFPFVELALQIVQIFMSEICRCHVGFYLCAGLDSISF